MTISALAVREQTDRISQAMDERQDQLAAFLPTQRHIERFKRVVIQSLAKNPDLLEASKGSLIAAAFEAARLGLEPSGAIGGAHLVRYDKTAQLIVDYRGLVELARRSDEILSIAARVVHEGESFKVHYGSRAGIEHEFDLAASTHPVIAVYAIAKLRGGGEQFDVMTTAEIDAIRAKSAAGNKGPWRTDWPEMAKKTVLRRLSKLLPLTVEAREALEREDEIERSTPQATEVSGLKEAIAKRTQEIAGVVPNDGMDSEDGLPDIPAADERAGTDAEAVTVQLPEPATTPQPDIEPTPDEQDSSGSSEVGASVAAPAMTPGSDLQAVLNLIGGELVDDGSTGTAPQGRAGDESPSSGHPVRPTKDAAEAAQKAAARARSVTA